MYRRNYACQHENQVHSAKKKEGANPGQLFWGFGPHQQSAVVNCGTFVGPVLC